MKRTLIIGVVWGLLLCGLRAVDSTRADVEVAFVVLSLPMALLQYPLLFAWGVVLSLNGVGELSSAAIALPVTFVVGLLQAVFWSVVWTKLRGWSSPARPGEVRERAGHQAR